MTRMHLSVLVCIVALVSLASARDILQVTTDTTGELVLQNAAVTAFEQPSALAEPSDVAATSTLIVPGTATVPVNGEICVEIPSACYTGTCQEMSGGGTYLGFSQIQPHVKQFCVARGAVAPTPQVPSPSSIPMSCGPTPGSWALPNALPTSWCAWPGVSCISPYTTTTGNNPPQSYPGPFTPVNTHPCASGIYIYSVHDGTTIPPNTPLPTPSTGIYRQGFYSSGFSDSWAVASCPNDTGYCLPTRTNGYGDPTITATANFPYTITIPRPGATPYTCNVGRDSQKKGALRCY